MILNKYRSIYVPQVDEMDCGVACLAMILKNYHSRLSLTSLRQLAKTNLNGTTAFGLVKASQSLGMQVKAIKADMSLFDTDSDEIKYPFIVHVIKQEKVYHYYVVLKNLKDKILIADPDPNVGIRKIDKDSFKKEWTGITLLMVPSKRFRKIREKKYGLLSQLPIILKSKKVIFQIITVSLIMTMISILSSYFLQYVIDYFIPKKEYAMITILSISLLVAYIFNSMFSYFQEILLNAWGNRLAAEINLGYLKHVFDLPFNFFANRRIGELVSRFEDINRIIDALASIVLSFTLDLTTLIIIGIVLIIQNGHLFFLISLSFPLLVLIIVAFYRKFNDLDNEQMESNSRVNSLIIDDLSGIETIKALNSERESYSKIKSQYMDFLEKTSSYGKLDALQRSLKSLIQLSLIVLILWIGSKDVMTGNMTTGELMSFNALLSYFIDPLQNIISLQPIFQAASVAQTRLNEVILTKSEFKKLAVNKLHNIEKVVVAKNVFYSYGFSHEILKNINFEINVGEKIAVVGMSGSGKSTLAKLLVAFFLPTRGHIYINGQELSNIDLYTLRSYINYIPQTPYIFAGTIRENLLLGINKKVSEEMIIKACKIADIYQEISNLPAGLETKLDDQAKILSGGQKQRLTIARAILSNAKVLILDEVTSGLDSVTERKVIDNLLSLKDKTIIFIVHHMEIVQKMDKILVLNNGKIVEQGSHQELIEQKGYYYDLFKTS